MHFKKLEHKIVDSCSCAICLPLGSQLTYFGIHGCKCKCSSLVPVGVQCSSLASSVQDLESESEYIFWKSAEIHGHINTQNIRESEIFPFGYKK